MKIEKTIYYKFKKQVLRLDENIGIQNFAETYILEKLDQSDLASLISTTFKMPDFTEQLLNNKSVLIQTVTILTLMELSENIKDLEKNIKKRDNRLKDPKQKDAEGFDKILKGIMKVPKPKENKKEGK